MGTLIIGFTMANSSEHGWGAVVLLSRRPMLAALPLLMARETPPT